MHINEWLSTPIEYKLELNLNGGGTTLYSILLWRARKQGFRMGVHEKRQRKDSMGLPTLKAAKIAGNRYV
jgi:hypothetical protein